MTDRAITNWRKHRPDQLIVHYMQPHRPFVTLADEGRSLEPIIATDGEYDEFDLLQRGDISYGEAWSAYKQTLRGVLKQVELLCRNIEADDIVVSADHGNAFGEWGVYGHLEQAPIDGIRYVPWCRANAEYAGDYEPPEYETDVEVTDDLVESRLADLGYM